MAYLSAKEFHEKYPIADGPQVWYKILERLREQGRLKQFTDWIFQKREHSTMPVRCYDEDRTMPVLMRHGGLLGQNLYTFQKQSATGKPDSP